ncbi:MAG: hypothetical protein DDT24_00278 [Chloroflexi bacterium]|nr:hypothetical protein [Chloroflexota bacterium]
MVITREMIPKAKTALTALKTTSVVQITDGRVPHALIEAIEGKIAGTVIGEK